MHFAELRQVVFERAAELAAGPPQRQQMGIDRELDQIGLLLLALAQFVVHHLQAALGVETDGVDARTHVDHIVPDRHRDAGEILLGADEHVLPVLETGAPPPQVGDAGTEVPHPIGEHGGLLAAAVGEQPVGQLLERRRPQVIHEPHGRIDLRRRREAFGRGQPGDQRLDFLVEAHPHGARRPGRREGAGGRFFAGQPFRPPVRIEDGELQLARRYAVMRHCR